MKTIYDKECPICGKIFTTPTKVRIYCDDCQKNAGRKMRKMRAAIFDSKRRIDDSKFEEYDCEYCGKHHKIPSYLLSNVTISAGARSNWNGERHFYCCKEHMEQDKKDHSSCGYCGKSLKGVEYPYSSYRPLNFCSEECEEAQKKKIAIEKGYVHKCKWCGKEFIRNNTTAKYCSMECTSSARKAKQIEARPDVKEENKPEKITVNKVCPMCGRKAKFEYWTLDDAFKKTFVCKGRCRELFVEAAEKRRKEIRDGMET